MFKKTLIITGASLAICALLQVFGAFSNIAFLDKAFLFSLLLLIVGGFSLLNAWHFFTLQKYAFYRVSQRIPFLATLFMNANSKATHIESKKKKQEEDEDEEEPADYVEYLERARAKVNAKDALPYLFSSVALTLVSILLSLIF